MAENSKFGPWTLSAAEQQRLKDYDRLQDLLSRKAESHDPLFQRDKKEMQELQQLWVDLPGLVCRVTADLILSKPPVVKTSDKNADIDARIAALMRRSRLMKLAWRTIFWTAGQGDTFLIISDVPGADEKLLPVISLRRATGSVARNIREEDAPKNRQFLFRSKLNGLDLFAEYLSGTTKYHAFKGNDPAALPEGYVAEYPTQEILPLVVHVAALRGDATDESFGESDFAGTEDLCFEIANRLRQVSKVLDRHSEPAMNVPDGSVDEGGGLNVRKKKVFERGVDGTGMEYVTWHSQLVEAYTEIDKLTDLILLLTETPAALWGRDKNGQAESGRALKFRLLSGLGKARRTGGMFSEALVEAVRIALRREDILSGRAPQEYETLQCELSDTFIADDMETVETIAKLRQSQVMSVQRAVEEGQGLSGTELEEEVNRITSENQNAAPLGLEPGRFLGG